MDLTINGIAYRTGRLSALEQFHVMRRLAPFFAVMGFEAMRIARAPGEKKDGGEVETLDRFMAVLPIAADILSKMPDEEANRVISSCLAVCSRHVDGNRYMPLIAQGGAWQFADLDMDAMLRLVLAVVEENAPGFWKERGEKPSSPSS